jgi:hypothetical protein
MSPELGEDASEVISDGGEDDVAGVASAAVAIAAAEVTFCLQVTDHGLDSGAAPLIPKTPRLAGDEVAARDLVLWP